MGEVTQLLEDWERQIRRIVRKKRNVKIENVLTLGSGATQSEISDAEKQLGVVFPDSLRELFLATNGLFQLDDELLVEYLVLPVGEIQLYRDAYKELPMGYYVDDFPIPDDEYFVYGSDQYPLVKKAYLRNAVLLSPKNTQMELILNIDLRFESGEYEVWDLSAKTPGAYRYRSLVDCLTVVSKHHVEFLKDEL